MKTDLEVKIFKALGHPVRLKIVKALLKKEVCVCQLLESTEFSQANLSQHLKVLHNAGLITKRKDGSFSHYSLTNPKIVKLIKICEDITTDYIKRLI
ncbi:MAG: transcriptional regulator [Fusobacteria bacterium]|nr:MAG: transcriptional regulator [Fusobacteriota bacterium]